MKHLLLLLTTALLLGSCALNSNTIIQGNDRFILGNNEHGKFTVAVKNISNEVIGIEYRPIAGGSHSPLELKPNESTYLRVDKNTALHFINNSNHRASVQLKVNGDLNLSMGYQK